MGQDKIDTQFLKDTVADVLVRACSECAVSQPKDPVGFVAGWLDQYVANDTILKKHEAAKQLAAEQEAAIEQVGGPSRFEHLSGRNERVEPSPEEPPSRPRTARGRPRTTRFGIPPRGI